MEQMHKRFTDEQVKALLKGYCQGILAIAVIEEVLKIGRSRFFSLLKEYRHDTDTFSIVYQRENPTRRLSASVEKEIKEKLRLEKSLIDNPTLPITTYNYSAVRDRLAKRGIIVALSTIIDRAKNLGCYQAHPRKKAHDREVITTTIGALIQHDASHHRLLTLCPREMGLDYFPG